MTNPEIPEEAVEAAHSAWRAEMLEHGLPRTAVEAALAAALPHLRVQETPAVAVKERVAETAAAVLRPYMKCSPQILDETASRAGRHVANALFTTGVVSHSRPVVDREAINHALNLHWWDEDEQPCVCGFDFLAAGQGFKMHLADVIAALLTTEEGEGS